MRNRKKNWLVPFAALAIAFLLAVPSVLAETPETTGQTAEKPQLTKDQTQEIKAIYDQIFELKKQLIEKYKAYGVIDEEKAGKSIEHMEERQEKLEKDGYVPQFDKKCEKHRKKHK
jgi:hypothetical protein